MIRLATLVLLGSVIASSPVCAQGKKTKNTKETVLFSVNGKTVSTDEFIYLYRKNHTQPQEDFTRAKIEEYLDLFVNFKLKVEEAHQRGMDTTDAFLKEYNQYRDELRKPYLPDARITDSLVQLTYNRMKEEVKASHILIEIKPDATPADTLAAYNKALDIRKKIVGGEDFSRAAVEYSEDKSVKSNQGNLGYFTAMQMVFPFENAAYTTPVGGISLPVRSRFGYHLVYVTDRRPARGEVEVSHIMLRTSDGKDPDKVKNTIFDLYDRLQAGVKWEELCREFSEDPGSRDNGGRLRPFGAGVMSSVPEFERVAFALAKPGEISDPFQTQYGWHIMRLERKIPLASLQELESSLKSRVTRDERTQLSKQKAEEKLRRDYKLTENASAKAAVLGLADSSLQKANWKPVFSGKSPGKQTLFSLLGRNYTIAAFLQYAQKNQRPNTTAPAKYLEQLYNQFIDASILTLQEEKIIQQNPDYRFLLHEYYEGILLFEVMEKEIWNKASADSVGQRRYYEAHAAQYQAPERADASIYYSGTRDFVSQLTPLLEAGDEAKIQEFVTAKKLKSESGIFKKDEKAVLQRVPWQKGVHPAENNGMYYLAWLKAILPAGSMSFEEARPAVISDYQAFLEKNWLDQLKKKYPVKINEKGRQHILQVLEKK